jgi:hypothetical protein
LELFSKTGILLEGTAFPVSPPLLNSLIYLLLQAQERLLDQPPVFKLTGPGIQAFITLAQIAQMLVSVQAGGVTVLPDRLEGVQPDRFQPLNAGFLRAQTVDKGQPARLAHFPAASRARAVPAQGTQLGKAAMPITPFNSNFPFWAVNFNFFRFNVFQFFTCFKFLVITN